MRLILKPHLELEEAAWMTDSQPDLQAIGTDGRTAVQIDLEPDPGSSTFQRCDFGDAPPLSESQFPHKKRG